MRVVELFAGAGGMSLGLKQAGMSIGMAFEYEEPMLRVYRRNLQNPVQKFRRNHAHQYDLNAFPNLVETITATSPDIVVGGPPCQDFSSAGNRVEGERARLTAYYAQLLCVVRPEWFILENVRGALGSDQYAVAKKLLKAAGYGISEHILLASYFGVPQRRRRLILIGRLNEQDGFLESAVLAKASKAEMSIKDAVGDRFGSAMYFHPRDLSRKAIWSTSGPAPTIRSASARNPGADFHIRPDVDDEIAGAFYNPSMRELALLQGFPEWWNWEGENEGKIATMIGNAVPPPLARAIGEVILDRHFGRSVPAIPDGFNAWLTAKGYTPPSIRNVRSRINSGRKLLRGRTFAVPSHEVGALEEAFEQARLTVKSASDIRISMRMLREFQAPGVTPALRAPTDFDEIRVANRRRTAHLPPWTRNQPCDDEEDHLDDLDEAV